MNYGNKQYRWESSFVHGTQGAIDTNTRLS